MTNLLIKLFIKDKDVNNLETRGKYGILSSATGIVVNILGATVQELQENVMCVFILQLIGTEEKILEAEKQIDENGVIRERVEAI